MSFLDDLRQKIAPLTVPVRFLFAGNTAEGDFYEHTADLFELFFAGERSADIQMYLDFARETGGPVLDIACGNLRIAEPLAAAGYEVFAFDKSREMMKRAAARRKLLDNEIQDRLYLFHGDMELFAVKSRFRLAIVPYNSFNHILSSEARTGFIKAAYSALVPGGKLVMEILPYHESYYEGFRLRKEELVQGNGKRITVWTRLKHYPEMDRHTVNWYVIESSTGNEKKLYRSTFTRSDIRLEEVQIMLGKAGFGIENILDCFPGEQKREDRRVIICNKA